jgi:hypothetical protein
MIGDASSRAADPAAAPHASASGLADHFARCLDLLEQASAVRADLAVWRKQARDNGLEPAVIVKLAREHLRDAEQERKAREAAEIERAYRAGLGLPLFNWATE